MNTATLVNVRQKPTAVICCVLLAFVQVIGCIGQKRRDEPARQRRSSSDNNNLSTVLCTQQLIPVDGTFEDMVDMLADVTNDYVSLVRIKMTYGNGNRSENQSGDTWHWGLGARGYSMLTFPFDNHSLSLTTLGFGLHTVSISLNSSYSQFDSISEICLGYSLSKHLKEVRSRVKNPGGFADNPDDDIICKERFLDSPSFSVTFIPGYSIFELQASSYYECWHVNTMETCVEDSCKINHSFRIDCTIVKAAFGITIAIIILAISFEIYHIFCKPYNYEDEDEDEDINILQISLIPPVSLMSISTYLECLHPKQNRIVYRVLIYSIPFTIYFVAFLWYVTRVDEYKYRSNRRGDAFKQRSAWGLDFGLANGLYVSGVVLFFALDYKFKGRRLAFYGGVLLVFILCIFRLSATTMLLVEILVLTAIGIAINITHVSTLWIYCILTVLIVIANIIAFFDSYQRLFSKIHSLGTNLDREENFPNKIFKQTISPQTQINFVVLQNIIKKWLPFWPHVMSTFGHIILGTVPLVILFVIVLLVDHFVHISSFVEYLMTLIPLAFGAAAKFQGISLTAGGRVKNHDEDMWLQLEEDLREFARTGEFPRPQASNCQSPSWPAACGRWFPCCAAQQDQNQYEMI